MNSETTLESRIIAQSAEVAAADGADGSGGQVRRLITGEEP